MLENLTLGQVCEWILWIGGFIGGVKYLKKVLTESLEKMIDIKLKPIKTQVDELNKKTNKNNLESIKTDLINLMELMDKGTISIEQKIRAHELYDYYCSHGGNSYVHDKWEVLKKEGKV